MARGPMAKHPAARQRRNAPAATSREITLRPPDADLLPAPDLPTRQREVNGELTQVDWHPQAKSAWDEMWQYPLVREAPESDRHQLYVYIALVDQFWSRLETGRAVTELSKEIRAFGEQWGFGEKSRRHLQITIADAVEAEGRIRKAQTKRVEQPPSAAAYTPAWTDDDEDDGSIVEAEVVQ